MEVDVVPPPPDEALTDEDAPVAVDRPIPARSMGQKDDMGMYISPLVLVRAADGAGGRVPVSDATSCEAVLVKADPKFPEGKTLGKFRVTSTSVAVLGFLECAAGAVLVRSVADGLLPRLRSRARSPPVDRFGRESLQGDMLLPARFPKRESPPPAVHGSKILHCCRCCALRGCPN